ncbi:MAG: hypothetical protein OEM15_05925 [Myxococcales bacterium]|nr:hypothetical protein [Myxococcales bacterium]MDH3483712.1 hypothetical protein [Myxococcales bacterium]
MQHFACILGVALMMASGAAAQEVQTTFSDGEEGVQVTPPEPADQPSEEKSSVYSKRVGGLVWLEATAGPSRWNVTQFRGLDFIPPEIASQIPSVVVTGPEFGAALKFRAGSTTVGGHFKRANYDPFDLITVGLDFGFLIRAVPYVHPTIKLGLNYYTTKGGLAVPGFENILTDVRTDGGGASMGLGLRIPIVKWVSLAADFDYSLIGLAVRGTETVSGTEQSITGGTAGTAISGTFALTVHLGS